MMGDGASRPRAALASFGGKPDAKPKPYRPRRDVRREQIGALITQLLDVVVDDRSEQDDDAVEVAPRARYYERSTSPLDLADWDRSAGRQFPVFRTGRRLLARVEDVHAYLERAPATRRSKASEAEPLTNDDAGPIPFRRRLEPDRGPYNKSVAPQAAGSAPRVGRGVPPR